MDEENTPETNVISFPGKKTGKTNVFQTDAVREYMDQFIHIKPEDYENNEEYLRRINIENLCNVFAMEMYFRLLNLGYDVGTPQFSKDMEFAQEAINSALLRTFDEKHPIQEYIDENFELVSVETTVKEVDPT